MDTGDEIEIRRKQIKDAEHDLSEAKKALEMAESELDWLRHQDGKEIKFELKSPRQWQGENSRDLEITVRLTGGYASQSKVVYNVGKRIEAMCDGVLWRMVCQAQDATSKALRVNKVWVKDSTKRLATVLSGGTVEERTQ